MRSTVAVVTVCLLGAACANRPESIHASYVSHEKFAHLDCPALDAKMRATRVSLAQYSQIQNSKADQDAIGVFLFGVPFSKLSGDVEGEVARLKGEVEAIETASIKKQCSTQTAGTMVNPSGEAVSAAAPVAAVAPAAAESAVPAVTTPNSWVRISDPDELRMAYSDTTIRGRLYGRNTADGTPYVGKFRSDGTGVVTFKGKDYPRAWEIRGIDTVCSRSSGAWDCYQLKRNSTNPNVYSGKHVSRDLWVEFTVERQPGNVGRAIAAPTGGQVAGGAVVSAAAAAPASTERIGSPVVNPSAWVRIEDPDELRSIYSDTTIRGRLYGRNTADGTPYVGKFRSDGSAVVTFRGTDYPRTWEIRGIDTACSRSSGDWDCYQIQRSTTNPDTYSGKHIARDLRIEFTVERPASARGPVAAAPAAATGVVGAIATAASPGPSALASSAPVAARQGTAIDGPLPGAGATWKYDFVDKYYPRNSTRFSVRVVRTAGDVVEEVLSAEGGTADPKIRTVLLRELRIQNYRPTQNCVVLEFAPYMAVEFGQQVPVPPNPISGYLGADGKDAGWRIRILRQGWERITVPAGTYRALRVALRGEQMNKQFRWGETGQFDLVVWYAPAVKRVVKVEHKSWTMGNPPQQHGNEVIELISYQPPS